MAHPLKHILVLQHHDCEGLGIIADALNRASITSNHIQAFRGGIVPNDLADASGLVVMGGPQSVYDQKQHPHLRDELRLIEDALSRGRPILGVCLGSQLLASALGARVYPGGRKEIGWNRVTLDTSARSDPLFSGRPKSFTAFHWHGDVFDVPQGAVPLASSSLTSTQAFRHGHNAYGLLFHMEVTFPLVRAMVETFADELTAAGLNGAAIKLNAHSHLPALQQIGAAVFEKWVALLQ